MRRSSTIPSTREFLLLLTVPHVMSPSPALDWCAGATPLNSSLHTSVHAVEAARDGWLRALAMTGPRASTHTARIAQWRVTTSRKRFAVRVAIAGDNRSTPSPGGFGHPENARNPAKRGTRQGFESATDRVRFELTVRFHVHTLSRRAP